jgi:predicted permease
MGWYRRLRNLTRRDLVERDIERELAFHLAERVDELTASGMSRDEALRAARRRFGNYAFHKERTREMNFQVWIESIGKDIRYAGRALRKSPAFTFVVVLTLAVGIGANTLIFSVVNGVLLRALPYRDSDRIMTLWQQNAKSGDREDGAAPANFFDWRKQSQVFSEMAAAEPYTHNTSEQGEPEAFRSWLVTEGFFEVLGVDALLGRTFSREEHQPGHEFVVVIGHGVWQQRFGGDPNLIGQRLRLNGQPHVVVGVMPPGFQFPPDRQLWAPRVSTERNSQGRGAGFLPVVARLKPGTTVPHAQQEMDAIAARLEQEYPRVNTDRRVLVVPLLEQTVGHVRTALLVLLGAVGFVLLIACSNVANLLLVRGAEREREFAIRGALGAGAGRLTGQWLIESCVLAFSGALAGIALAYAGLRATLALIPNNLPRLAEIAIDGRVLGFTLAVSLLTAFIFGLAPALRYTKPNLSEALRQGGRSIAGLVHYRLRDALVVSEIALALILLIGAGLLGRSFVRLLQTDPGFAADRLLSLEVHVWGWSPTPEKQGVFFEQTLDRLAALPGVQAAAVVSALPFHDNRISLIVPFTIDRRPAPLPGQEPTTYLNTASSDYFRALGIPVRSGRVFTQFDRPEAPPVAVINETLANRYWPSEDPVGRKITTRLFGRIITCEIVGVVGDVRSTGLDSEPRPELFLPLVQSPSGSMTYVLRTAGDPMMMLPAVKNEIWAVNKNLPFASVATIEQLVSRSVAARRFNLLLLGSFAVIALTLAGIGLYGLISFSTRQRKDEICVRMALGATRRNILGMIMTKALLLTSVGVSIGLAGALGLTRFLQSLLFNVGVMDPLTFVAVSALVVAVALLASYIPARRTTRLDPMPGR